LSATQDTERDADEEVRREHIAEQVARMRRAQRIYIELVALASHERDQALSKLSRSTLRDVVLARALIARKLRNDARNG
jgi:hypothetical protein